MRKYMSYNIDCPSVSDSFVSLGITNSLGIIVGKGLQSFTFYRREFSYKSFFRYFIFVYCESLLCCSSHSGSECTSFICKNSIIKLIFNEYHRISLHCGHRVCLLCTIKLGPLSFSSITKSYS